MRKRAGKQPYRYDFYTRVFNNPKTQTVMREEQCELLLQVSPPSSSPCPSPSPASSCPLTD